MNNINQQLAQISAAVAALNSGGVIAYPTEAVYGVGCDPDNGAAVAKLLAVKQRPIEKGLILVAATLEQLQPYIDFSALDSARQTEVIASWPGPNTWLMPVKAGVPAWLTGQFTSLAVRVSDHPVVQQLCLAYGKPITSTSANLTGLPPCLTAQQVEQQLAERVASIIDAPLGLSLNPTTIRDAVSGAIIRQG